MAEAKAREGSKKSPVADIESGSSAGISPKNIDPGEDALKNTEDRLQGGTEGVKTKAGSGSSGVKRVAANLSISSAVSSEKRARSGERDAAMPTSSKETHSSYFTTATHVSSSDDTVPSLKNQTGSPFKTPLKNSAGGVGKLYVTPTKSFIQALAKSPNASPGPFTRRRLIICHGPSKASLPKGLLQATKQNQLPRRKFPPSTAKAISAQCYTGLLWLYPPFLLQRMLPYAMLH